jgi:hypothetical protein
MGLSQSFSDQCASGVRRRDGLTFGYGSGIQTPVFLSTVVPTQVRQSETPLKIVREKTLRQAPFAEQPEVAQSNPRSGRDDSPALSYYGMSPTDRLIALGYDL